MAKLIGSANINIRASDKFFEKDVQKMVKGLKDITLDIKADLNLSDVNTKLNQFKKQAQGQLLKFELDLSTGLAHDRVENFMSEYDGQAVSLNLDIETGPAFAKLASAITLIEETTAVIDVDANITKAEAALASVSRKRTVPIDIAAESEAEEVRKVVEEHLQDLDTTINVNVDNSASTKLKREMDALAVRFADTKVDWDIGKGPSDLSNIIDHVIVSMRRDFRTKVNSSFVHLGNTMYVASRAAEGLFSTLGLLKMGVTNLFNAMGRSGRFDDLAEAAVGFGRIISGTFDFKKIKAGILSVVSGFESITMMTSLVTAGLSNLGSMALVAGGNLLTVGRDISQLAGLAAALPAVVAGAAVGVSALTMAWKGFSDAFDKDPKKAAKALALLPKEAQEAVKGIRGVGTEIRKATQTSYWKSMGTALQDTVKVIKGPLTTGMSGAGAVMAEHTVAILDSLKSFTGISDVFKNINTGFKNAVGGTKEFTDAFLVLTREGSKRLPMLGTWITTIGTQFGDWIDKSAANGDILKWIDTGVQRLKELWSIGKDSIGILSGFADMATAAGASGLTDFATAMANIRSTIDSPAFREGMTTVFEAAYDAVDKLGDGIGTLGGTIGQSADEFGIILRLAGDIGKLTFENIDKVFNGTKFGEGIYGMLEGLKDALTILEPSFINLGNIIGDVGLIMGELLRNLAPGLNQLTGTLEGVIGKIRDGVINVMPSLNEFVQTLLSLAQGPIMVLAGAVGDLLSAFSRLPGGIQTVILTLALVARAGAPVLAFLSNFGTRLATTPMLAGTAFQRVAGAAATMSERVTRSLDWRRNFTQISTAWSGVSRAFSSGNINVSGFTRIKDGAKLAAGALGTTAAGGLRAAAGGIMGVLGGPWGVAIAAASVALMLWAQKNQEAKAKIDSLKSSIDEQTGAFTGQSAKIAADQLIDSDSFKKAAENVGLNVGDIATKLTTGGKGFEEYGTSWNHIAQQIKDTDLGSVLEGAAAGEGAIINAINNQGNLAKSLNVTEEMARKLGFESKAAFEALSDTDVRGLAEGIGTVGMRLEEVRNSAKDTQLSLENMVGAKLADNLNTMQNSMSSVDDKFSAFQSTLRLTGAETLSTQSAMREFQETSSQGQNAISKLNDALSKTDARKLYDVKTGFDLVSESGRTLYDTVSQQADSIQKVAVSAYDAALKNGQTIEQASSAALTATTPLVAGLRNSLTELGLAKPQIDSIIDAAGLIPKDIKMGLTLDGAEEARLEAIRTKVAVDAVTSQDYTMFLKVMDDDVRDKLAASLSLGENFSSKDFTAKISVLADQANMTTEQLLMHLAAVEDPWRALVELGLVDEATPKLNAVKESAKQGAKGTIKIDANTDSINPALAGAKQKVDSTEGKLKVGANTDDVGVKLSAAKTQAQGTKIEIPVSIAKPDTTSLPSFLTGGSTAAPAIKARVEVDQSAIAGAVSQINGTKAGPIKVTVSSNVGAEAGKIRGALASIKSTPVKVNVSTNAPQAAAQARAAIGGIKSSTVAIKASSNVPQVASAARSALGAIKSTTATIKVSSNAPAIASQARAAINGVKEKTVAIKGNANDALSKASAVIARLSSIRDKTINILANNSQALGAIAAVNSRRVFDKSNTITTYTRTVAKNEIGGIYQGGVQTFASGGINSKALRAINRHSGKDRNRVAQIAKASSNYRVWAEEETEGEAYIPFSKSKRKRSMQILSQVANKFGMGLYKSYADGGFNGALPNRTSGNVRGGSGVSSGLMNAIIRTLSKDSGRLTSAGTYVVKGIVAGINSSIPEARSSILNVSNVMDLAFRDANEIHSPSRTYAGFGRDLVKGLAVGIKSTRVTAIKAIRDLSNKMYTEYKSIGARMKSADKKMDSAKKSATKAKYARELSDLRRQYNSLASVRKSLSRQDELSTFWVKSKKSSINDALHLANAVQYRLRTKTTKDNIIGGKTLTDYARAIELVNSRYDLQKKKLTDLTNTRNQAASSMKGQIKNEFNVGSLVGSADSFGYRAPTTAASVKSYAAGVASRISKFSGKLNSLKKLGYNSFLISEVAGLGSEEGTIVADALMQAKQNDSTVKDINKSYASINASASSIGNKTADWMYKAGIDAQKGLIKGLSADVSALQKAADYLGDTLVRQLKKKLKIKSPSRVFFALGQYIPQGLAGGIDSMRPVVDDSINNLVSTPNYDFSVGNTQPDKGNYTSGRMGRDSKPTIIQHIHPTPGMSEKQIGDASARELMFRYEYE